MDTPRTRVTWIVGALALVLVAILSWRLLGDPGEPASADAADSGQPRVVRDHALGDRQAPSLGLRGTAKAAISGTIRDPAGRPIADAHVCALPNTKELLGLDDHVRACARSEADGHYRIDGLFPVQTGVSASAATYKPTRWQQRVKLGVYRNRVQLRPGETSEGIDITLEAGGVLIRGVIKDIAGGEIEGAQVSINGGWANRRQGAAIGVSDDQGQFELWVAPGDAHVSAFADGYAEGGVRAVAPGEFVELFLTPESVLVGRVVLASTGEGVEGVTVGTNFGFGADHAAMTDTEGWFRIDQLAPGVYKPSAWSDELFGELAEQVHLGLGETSDPVVIRVHPAVRVDGDVLVAGSKQPCTLGLVDLESDAGVQMRAPLDDAGHVSFRGVLPGEYTVTIYCVGAIADEDYPKLTAAVDSVEQLWEVREGLAIRGEVVDEAGEGVESIGVVANPVVQGDAAREQVTRGRGLSETHGQFELAGLLPGVYEVQVRARTGRQGPTEPITVELEAGADINDIQIVMPGVGTIRGRIVDEDGAPVSGTAINAARIGSKGGANSRSDDLGEFELHDLRPGPTRVTARDSNNWSASSTLRKPGTTDDELQGEVVEVVADEVVELVLTVEPRNGRITGSVTDEGGGPVADAFIHVDRMSDKAGANLAAARRTVRWSWGSQPVLTDQDGRFEVDQLPDGKYMVHANRKGGGEAIAEGVALGGHVELVITSTGELAGTVELADGTAPERFSVFVEDKAGGFARRDSFFRTDGVWRLREMPAGSYEITATSAAGTATLETPLPLAEGELREGVELVLASRLSLRGRIVDLDTREGVAGLRVYVSATGEYDTGGSDGDHLNISDAEGRFEVEDAPAGRVRVHATSRHGNNAKYDKLHQAMTLEPQPLVQDIGELEIVARQLEPDQKPGDLGYTLNARNPTLDPEDFEAIVASVRPGGPADAAGLVAGDVIEKVAGYGVLGREGSRYPQLTRVPAGSSLKLDIRGGKAVQIVVGPPLR